MYCSGCCSVLQWVLQCIAVGVIVSVRVGCVCVAKNVACVAECVACVACVY